MDGNSSSDNFPPPPHSSPLFYKDMAADLAVLKIREAHNHLEKIAEFEKRGINGAQKLKKRILAEIKFLQKVYIYLIQ
ncbi:hypothetical protein E2C01_044333 [Portunus trituberculatus]|uniref:Uncharacterized protein n=1 Tax=Portunus trituberculatus TaxID=210409 RepID=A0A5B7G202_PORTR|nr:hypothetical protein [Portunus trituberculatus]